MRIWGDNLREGGGDFVVTPFNCIQFANQTRTRALMLYLFLLCLLFTETIGVQESFVGFIVAEQPTSSGRVSGPAPLLFGTQEGPGGGPGAPASSPEHTKRIYVSLGMGGGVG